MKYNLDEIFDFVTDDKEWKRLVKEFKLRRKLDMKSKESIQCPKCKEETYPEVSVTEEGMLIAVECSECGYDMKKELMEAIQ